MVVSARFGIKKSRGDDDDDDDDAVRSATHAGDFRAREDLPVN